MGDTQNDDLQNAINGIVNGAGAQADAPTTDGIDLGAAPVPPIGGGPDIALPDFSAPSLDLTNAAPQPIEDQASDKPDLAPISEPAPAETVAESVEKMPATNEELSDVKKSMIKDLIPLMDKVELTAEKKFAFYKEAIEANHDKSMVPAAYEAAKGIADDTAKAEALLYLIDEAE